MLNNFQVLVGVNSVQVQVLSSASSKKGQEPSGSWFFLRAGMRLKPEVQSRLPARSVLLRSMSLGLASQGRPLDDRTLSSASF